MTATLGNYMTSDENLTRVMQGIAGAVSVTAPPVVLVLVFQGQIVSGLTQGAVKG